MRILVVGALGSIGKRYSNILRQMAGVEVVALDPAFDVKGHRANWFKNHNIKTLSPSKGQDYVWPKRDQYKPDKVLIASPTDTHDEWCRKCIEHRTAFMCEKPLTKSLDTCASIAKAAEDTGTPGHMVCNYKFALQGTTRSFFDPISYDFYHFSNDDEPIEWAACQLLLLNPDIILKTDSAAWTLVVEYRRRTQNLPYRKIELGYIEMLADWVGGGENCWKLEDGVKMTAAVLERLKKGVKKNGALKKIG
jgi:hypothetical protein